MQGYVGPTSEATLDSIVGHASDAEESIHQEELKRRVRAVAKAILSPQQYEVLFLAYELGSTRKGAFIEEAAAQLNIPSHRARSIKAAAMRKLRHPAIMKQLQEYL
jgi:DNA-directed RNA polymerase sigma subunit (sigma70/sigma32)